MDIRSYRKQAGLTLEQFAEKFGVTAPTVSRWEMGLVAVPLARAAEIERLTQGAVTMQDIAASHGGPRAKGAA